VVVAEGKMVGDQLEARNQMTCVLAVALAVQNTPPLKKKPG
jgi:hypothetical protein